ncbi:MAG: carbamoyltransferase HypF [Desulfamplus sp.]|nr:carbamoyltransferase HypF [Desulfamplus sp.]
MNNSPIAAKEIKITGVVQGVGFRPFIFQLALHYGLKGEVFNTVNGVTVIVETTLDNLKIIDKFQADIRAKKPPLAIIDKITSREISPCYYKEFLISKSSENSSVKDGSFSKLTLISPDVCVCDDCVKEMENPKDRRFGYPFINCTNCGPRYTIIKDTPYDRAKTSMQIFKMCEQCQKEYDDPLNRRFHAQPNCCSVCGPHLFVVDRFGKVVVDDKKKQSGNSDSSNLSSLDFAAIELKSGKIVAIKGLGGFHLAVDANNKEAVQRLRRLKKREHKPFALMAKSVDVASKLVFISSEERQILESYHRPITLLLRRNFDKNNSFAECPIAPNNQFLGIMLPYTPLHYLLLEKSPEILVMTSGNRSGEPLSIDNQDALESFSHIADYFVFHNRDIYFRADDSIVQIQNQKPRFFRRSRGYAPIPIILTEIPNLPDKNISILGCGAALKNTVCLTKGNMAFLSQHIGDVENERVFQFYKDSISHLKKIFNINPQIVAHDLHPDYLTTKFALSIKEDLENNKTEDKKFDNKDIILLPVQHHHAHAVSCMAENQITGDVIAITLDGTGLGSDGKIWGGEVLICNEKEFKRGAHLKYIPMPGGDAAAKEPWRMAISYLYAAFGKDIFNLKIPFLNEVLDYKSNGKIEFILQMIDKNINCPLTSSCGRLFDAVASICSIRHKITFESQAAIELQAKCGTLKDCEKYDFAINQSKYNDKNKDEELLIIDLIPLIKNIVHDIQRCTTIESISSKFHQTIIDSFVCASEKVSCETGIKRVVLSGGVFNNMLILSGMTHALEKKGFRVYSHSKVPSGDGGISLGQVVIAKRSII